MLQANNILDSSGLESVLSYTGDSTQCQLIAFNDMFTISVKNCPSCSSMTSLEDCNGKIQLKTCSSFFSDRFACAVIQYKQDFYSRTCISDFTKVRAEKFGICMEDQCLANLTFTAGKLILVIAFSLLSNGIFLLTHTQRDMVHGCLLDDFIQICHGILPTLSFVVAFYKDTQESSAQKKCII